MNVIRNDDTGQRDSIKGRLKQAGWDQEYLGRSSDSDL